MINPAMGEEWRPSKARLMVTMQQDGKTVQVLVDPSRPGAWRDAKFLPTFRQWAASMRVIVRVDRHHYVVFPDHIAELGALRADESIEFFYEETAGGQRVSARKTL